MVENDAGITGGLLDDFETELRERYQHRVTRDDYDASDQAITAAELAEKYDIDDSDGHPKTREALRFLMEERGIPQVSNNNGTWIPVERDAIDAKLEELNSRIAGMQERKQLIKETWESWQHRQEVYAGDEHAEQPTEEATTDGGHQIPDDVREKIENDPVLTVSDWVEHQGGDA